MKPPTTEDLKKTSVWSHLQLVDREERADGKPNYIDEKSIDAIKIVLTARW